MDAGRPRREARDPRDLFGQLDIYILDQLLRGRIAPGMRVLDAGCGRGRNLAYFLRAGYEVFGVDVSQQAITAVRALAAKLRPDAAADRFRVEPLESISLAAQSVDVVLCNAVLHFARDDAHFDAMLAGAWGALRGGGLFFARLASSIGIETRIEARGARRYGLPDGSERYLVDEARLIAATKRLGGTLLDPIKTTNVQNQRCMTTWVVQKGVS